jgi:hypothetical protein
MPQIPKKAETPETESELQSRVRRALAELIGVRVYRNNVGVLKDERGQHVRYGLSVGSADLIGSVTIATTRGPVAVSLAVEVKRPGCKPTPEQVAWLSDKEAAGWIVGVARSAEDGVAIVNHGVARMRARLSGKP